MVTQIVVNPSDRKVHDIWIEPSAAVRAEGVNCCDPQHGGSRIRGVRSVETEMDRALLMPDGTSAPACAATAAFYLPGPTPWEGRICLREDAGADDFVAAAILSGMGIESYPLTLAMRDRLAELARADNAAAEGLPEWEPGQRLRDVTTTFPGLARACASRTLPAATKVRVAGEWLQRGWAVLTRLTEEQRLELLGNPRADNEAYNRNLLYDQAGEALLLCDMDVHAREEIEAGRAAMRLEMRGDDAGRPLVALVHSALNGPSTGRGALSYGYEHCPVAVACSPLSGERYLVTIARASNARRVTFDWTGLRDALCALEPGWGGNQKSCILGSPKPHGTTLDLYFIRDVVARNVRWVA